MKTLRISALTASLSLMLAACGGATSGLSNAVTEPLNTHPKGVLSVELNESVPENGTLELTANGKTQTLQKGGKLDTGFLKTDKVSSYDYAQKKIEVNGQVITLEMGDFQVYKQNYSTVAARYAKQKPIKRASCKTSIHTHSPSAKSKAMKLHITIYPNKAAISIRVLRLTAMTTAAV
ncbi:factor H binding protein [Neisseria meningitidis]|nr:factor H binding protein [Neisseria meningitidis]